MTKTKIKHTAQDYLMQGLSNAILGEIECNSDPEVIAAMKEQAARVMKFLGYSSFPGID